MLESGVNMLKYTLLYWHSEYARNYTSIKGQGLPKSGRIRGSSVDTN